MKYSQLLNKDDWHLLRKPLISFLITLVVCIVLFATLLFVKARFERGYQVLSSEYSQMQIVIRQFYQEKSIVFDYSDRFQLLLTNGLVEAEDRLLFLENIRQLREINTFFPISLELGKQSSNELHYVNTIDLVGDPVSLTNSEVEIALPLLHEGEFFELLQAISAMNGSITPVKCQLDWHSFGDRELNLDAANVNAACTFQWLSFNLNPQANDSYGQESYDEVY